MSNELLQVLCYHNVNDTAVWCTPAEAARHMAVCPHLEIIEPFDKNYDAVRTLAGPMPVRMVDERSAYK